MISIWPNNRLRVIVTGVCNAHCPHCHNEGVAKASRFINPHVVAILAKIADKLNAPFKTVTFTGGEPLLHPKIVDLCSIVSDVTSGITIPTNGLRLTNKKILDLAAVGVTRLRIDLDPWRFERPRDNARNLNEVEVHKRVDDIRNAGLSAAVNTVLTHYSVQQIKELLLFCEAHTISIKVFERSTRSASSGRFVRDPDVPFSTFRGIVRELYPLATYTSVRGEDGDVEWHGTPFSLRYCRTLCATGACKLSGLRCDPEGRLSVCVNQFGPETISDRDNVDSAQEKVFKVLEKTCAT